MISEKKKKKSKKEKYQKPSGGTEAGVNDGAVTANLADSGAIPTVQDDAETWGIDERIVRGMQKAGINHFFSIQRQALPFILKGDEYRTGCHEDVCVSAPTGSGKTLVFVIATLQMLLDRVVTRLRALVVLPSRDLAIQVKSVFDIFCDDASVDLANRISVTKLSVGLTVGLKPLNDERRLITNSFEGRVFCPGCESGNSRVDILVCTPGRLMDHVRGTHGFTLQHLRVLVVDEADRLLAQSYHGWVESVLKAVKRNTILPSRIVPYRPVVGGYGYFFDPCATPERQYYGSTSVQKSYRVSGGHLRKLLFSATLTNDPEKMSSMELVNPRFVSLKETASSMSVDQEEQHQYHAPEGLVEHRIVCESRDKPIVLFQLLESFRNKDRTIIFASSVEATHRLCALLQIMEEEFGALGYANGDTERDESSNDVTLGLRLDEKSSFAKPSRIEEYSSRLTRTARSRILDQFRDSHAPLKILVCSDAMARGLDIEQVQHVVNYDLPIRAETYIHRVGRAARAGRAGSSYSIMKPTQVPTYETVTSSIKMNSIVEYTLDPEKLVLAVPKYSKALKTLKERLVGSVSNPEGASDLIGQSASLKKRSFNYMSKTWDVELA
jgi:ATP-dependent RNA helicase DDX51/DBP6|eukprot:Stramenopile-MAST_4_protein_3556